MKDEFVTIKIRKLYRDMIKEYSRTNGYTLFINFVSLKTLLLRRKLRCVNN